MRRFLPCRQSAVSPLSVCGQRRESVLRIGRNDRRIVRKNDDLKCAAQSFARAGQPLNIIGGLLVDYAAQTRRIHRSYFVGGVNYAADVVEQYRL